MSSPPGERNGKAQLTPAAASVLPPAAEEALEKVVEAGGPKALLAIFAAFRSTTTTFGPDPETATILVQSEMHEEDCRLKGYQASLENREKQSQRDHEYRKKKLNHQSLLTAVILLASVAGIGVGLYLSAKGSQNLGNPVVVASLTVLSALVGKLLSSREKD